MIHYDFDTTWRLDAPVDLVWEAIYHSERWPDWWRGLLSVTELQAGDADGIGNVRRYVWQGALPYRLVFDIRVSHISRPHLLMGMASGDLAGTGVWRLRQASGGVELRYRWQVATQKWWMNRLEPLARPVFCWNHDLVMRWGEAGLARHLRQQQSGTAHLRG